MLNVEQTISSMQGRLDQVFAKIESEDQDLRNRLQTYTTQIETKMVQVDEALKKIHDETTRLAGLTTQDMTTLIQAVTAIGGNEIPRIVSEGSRLSNDVQGLQGQLNTFVARLTSVEAMNTPVTTGFPTTEGYSNRKPITDSKVWDAITRLCADKAGFRDWKVRFKDAMQQVSRCALVKPLLGFLESPNRVSEGTTSAELLVEWDIECADEGYMNGREEWRILSEELNTVLLQKSEDKSAAFLPVKRARGLPSMG